MKDKQNKTRINLASRGTKFAFDGQRINKLAFEYAAVFRVELHGGFEAAFFVQTRQFFRADAEADGIVFDTYVHGRQVAFNGVTVTCAL